MWEKQWYPALIFGVISTIFVFFWLLDPPIFTILATTGIIVTLMDYFVPVLIKHLYTPDSWNKNKEKLFEEICKNMVLYYNWMYYTTESFYKMRESSPRMVRPFISLTLLKVQLLHIPIIDCMRVAISIFIFRLGRLRDKIRK